MPKAAKQQESKGAAKAAPGAKGAARSAANIASKVFGPESLPKGVRFDSRKVAGIDATKAAADSEPTRKIVSNVALALRAARKYGNGDGPTVSECVELARTSAEGKQHLSALRSPKGNGALGDAVQHAFVRAYFVDAFGRAFVSFVG